MSQDLDAGASPPEAPQPGPVAGRVVVGTDGSSESHAAVELAADEAWNRGVALHVLAVAEPARGTGLDLSSVLRLRSRARLDAGAARAAGVTAARTRCPGLTVTAAVVPASDDAAEEQAVRARAELEGSGLLVVGSRGRRGVPAFAMGTTSAVLAAVSTCPVLVAAAGPPTAPPAGLRDPHGSGPSAPVVACVDDRRPLPVLAAAAQEAAAREGDLVVVHVVDRGRSTQDRDQDRDRVQELVRTVVPTTTTATVRVVAGDVVEEVLAAAAQASVVVIGSRGTLALAGLALGSVSHEVLRRSPVPVLLARATPDREPVRARQRAGAG